MVRRLGLVMSAAFLAATLLPATAAAVGPGKILHGGSPTAPVTVQCALNLEYYAPEGDYDVFATIDPDLVIQADTAGEPFAVAYAKTSAKASAPSALLDTLYTGDMPYENFAIGDDLVGPGLPFTYVQVLFGYWDPLLEQVVLLGSGTAKCRPGDLLFD